MSAANELLTAIHAKLAGDAGLSAMIGPDAIHDRLLPRREGPAIVFATMETRDFSTGSEPGEEHVLVIEIWSEDEGRRRCQEIASRVSALLHDAALALENAVLVNLLRIGMRSRRDAKTRFYVVELRLRAVTE